MKTISNIILLLLAAAGTLTAQITNVIFLDDVETGTMAKWTTTGVNPLDPSAVTNVVPPSPTGRFSAYMNTSLDRMHHNIVADNGGTEVDGHSVFTCWIYDPGSAAPATRIFCEVRGYSGGTGIPNGGTMASGSLAQLLAIGKYNTVTLPGETFNGSKYQGRSILGVDGWFNLNAAGSPNRSTGWHRFDIERVADGTTINFFVDGILSRTITGTGTQTWDTVILGPGLGSTVGDAWIDGMSVGVIRPDTQPPVITDFFPREGGEGTVLTINGMGFHGQPDDHCLVLAAGQRFIDVEVLTATSTQLVARVGVIPPAYQGAPLQLRLGVGQGAREVVCPQFRDVQVAPDNWIWRGFATDTATAQGVFFALVSPIPPTNTALLNFHSSPPMGSMLTVTLNRDWAVGARFCISARVHAQGSGADTRIGPATFTGNGNRFDCAIRICDLLVQAFASHPQRPLTILCNVLTNGPDAVIKITLPTGQPLDGGNIDIIQKAPPPIVTGVWDIQNAGLWRKEVRKHEIARWYRCYEWRTINSIWFERRAEGLWITREAIETFTCRGHCIYRFPNGRIWVIWRTYTRADLVRFWVHYRFWWPGRLNPLLPVNDPRANRTMMSMDDLQIVLPMTPADPNPATPFNEAVMIVDENGLQHFQGQPGFEVMPDVAGNPNGFQIATTAESTAQLPPAADRIRDLPMQPMPGMANLQPGVIIQWLVDKNGNVLVDHNNDGWPDPIASPHVLGNQKHQGLIAQPTGNAGTVLPVDQGNNQLQLFCWELDPNGEVRGASPGQIVIGPPVDVNGDGVADGPMGGPVPADPTVRELVVTPSGLQEARDPTAKAFDLAVVEEAAPTDAQLAAMNQNLAAQLPGFVPLQRPFILCINRIWVRRMCTIDRRFVFDTWFHHWTWHHRNHIILTHPACRVWLTKVSLSSFSYAQHCFPFGLPPAWQMSDLTQVRFFRVCFRVISVGLNQIAFKIDQMHVTLPQDPANPNSPLMLLSTRGDENALFQEVPPAVLAGLQPDPLPVGPDGVFVEPIDPVVGTLDIGLGGTGVFGNRPMEARGMLPVTLDGNEDSADAPANNQLKLYCWALNPNGTLAQETFLVEGAPVTLAMTPTPALPSFDDDLGNEVANPTTFITTITTADNAVRITLLAGGGAELSWDGPGRLEGSNNVEAGYTDVPGGSTSPVTVTTGQMKRFFRVRR